MTTDKKPSTEKPPAEVVGSFEDVMRRGECDDGRSLFCFDDGGDYECTRIGEIFVLAASELQAWKAMHSSLGRILKMTRGKMFERYKQEALKLMEKQSNGETKEDGEEKDAG